MKEFKLVQEVVVKPTEDIITRLKEQLPEGVELEYSIKSKDIAEYLTEQTSKFGKIYQALLPVTKGSLEGINQALDNLFLLETGNEEFELKKGEVITKLKEVKKTLN